MSDMDIAVTHPEKVGFVWNRPEFQVFSRLIKMDMIYQEQVDVQSSARKLQSSVMESLY